MSAAATLMPGPGAALSAHDFQAIADLLHRETGIHLPEAKRAMVEGRLAKRLRHLGIAGFADYRALIESPEGAEERSRMLAALTTNVTRFNREPHHFEALRRDVLPPLAAQARKGGRVRLWSAACSSGEEPYSMALALLAVLPEARSHDVRVLATDINADMVARGRAGVYPAGALQDVPSEERSRWFEPMGERSWRAGPALSGLVAFRVLNLIGDWPMTGGFDVVLCRNVVIYFDPPTQARLWSRIAALIPPGGHLFIGHSERLTGPAAALFRSVGVTMYRREGGAP